MGIEVSQDWPVGTYDERTITALAYSVLRATPSLTADGVARQISLAGLDESQIRESLFAHSGYLFEQDRQGSWAITSVASRRTSRRVVAEGSPTRAEVVEACGLLYAKLPATVESVVRKHVAVEPAAAPAIVDRLHQLGWHEISLEHLLLHLAHFQDFRVEVGLWHLDSDELEIHESAKAGQAPASAPSPATSMTPYFGSQGRARSSAHAERTVFITGKGSAYHWDPDCHLLRHGWAMAFDDGAHPTGLRSVSVSQAERSNRHPCRGCTGSG